MKRMIWLLLLLLIPSAALGEITLSLSADTVAMENILDFEVPGNRLPLGCAISIEHVPKGYIGNRIMNKQVFS